MLTTSANPSGYGKAVTLTDTVSGNATLGAPTGTVSFADTTSGNHVISGCSAVHPGHRLDHLDRHLQLHPAGHERHRGRLQRGGHFQW